MPVDWCKEGWLLTAGRALQAEGGKGGMEAESGEIYMYNKGLYHLLWAASWPFET